jgi:hydrogenase maturation protein HypF
MLPHDVPNAAMLIHSETRRLRLDVQGVVQGVGFRPFVYRLATELSVRGWIVNDPGGVRIEVEGDATVVARFAERLQAELPPRAAIHTVREAWLRPAGDERFEIRASGADGPRTAVVLPDIATCDACLDEVLDPNDRRRCYPFTNCTDCGPRFSIIRALPYDRPNTSMVGFTMCDLCAAEYADPHDRRFHAQPNACPECGPRLELRDVEGSPLPVPAGAELRTAARALRQGRVLAVKGIGGFHLMVDAASADAVARLRARKHRPAKPLAIMAPSLDAARGICEVDDAEAALLRSPEAPIVLLRRREGAEVAPDVAPALHRLGVMLPCTPLHHLLLREFGAPVVATSGNLSEEPICTDEAEAIGRLGGIADLFLVHDRPIERHVDDSVAWTSTMARRGCCAEHAVTRRSPYVWPPACRHPGGRRAPQEHGRTRRGDRAFISQHIGDLDAPESQAAFERVPRPAPPPRGAARGHRPRPAPGLRVDRLGAALARAPAESTDRPCSTTTRTSPACMAENGASGSALGVVWDGTGYGTDGTVWGGEFLLGDAARVRARRAPAAVPAAGRRRGDARAAPRRARLLWELREPWRWSRRTRRGDRSFSLGERRVLGSMLAGAQLARDHQRRPPVRRVAALLGLCTGRAFEGEAAMPLEWAGGPRGARVHTRCPLVDAEAARRARRWTGARCRRGASCSTSAAARPPASPRASTTPRRRGAQAELAAASSVALTGGCFQNRLLAERAARAAPPGLPRARAPPGPAERRRHRLGQVAVAAARLVPTATHRKEPMCLGVCRAGVSLEPEPARHDDGPRQLRRHHEGSLHGVRARTPRSATTSSSTSASPSAKIDEEEARTRSSSTCARSASSTSSSPAARLSGGVHEVRRRVPRRGGRAGCCDAIRRRATRPGR